MALGSDSSVKFCIAQPKEPLGPQSIIESLKDKVGGYFGKGAEEDNSEMLAGQISYTTAEQEDENAEVEVDVLVSVQRIQPTSLINELMTVKLVTAVKQIDCDLVIEAVKDPKPEIRIKATLKLYNKRLFAMVQDLQK